jgi:hypothetical protein
LTSKRRIQCAKQRNCLAAEKHAYLLFSELKLGDKLILLDLLLLLNVTQFFCPNFYLKDDFYLRTRLACMLGSKAVKMPIYLVK